MGPIGICLNHFRHRWVVKIDFSLVDLWRFCVEMSRFERLWSFYKQFPYKSLINAQICSFLHKIFTNLPMKNRFSQTNDVENGSNMSQSVSNIKINHQKHILDLYKWHKDHPKKSGWNRFPKKIPNRRSKEDIQTHFGPLKIT